MSLPGVEMQRGARAAVSVRDASGEPEYRAQGGQVLRSLPDARLVRI